MHHRLLLLAAFSLGFTIAGCKDKPAPQGATLAPDVPPPVPSATAAVVPAPSASAQQPPPPVTQAQGPRFLVQRRTSQGSGFAWLGAGIVICEDLFCMEDAQLITEKGLTDTYNPTGFMKQNNPNAFQGWPGTGVRYHGNYPEVCATDIYWNDRTDSSGSTYKRTGKTWSRVDCSGGTNYSNEDPIPRTPRDLDDALLHAPIADAANIVVHGAGSPPMLITEQTLYSWDGKTWSKREAPWKKSKQEVNRNKYPLSKRPVRLTSGSTLVVEGGYLIDAKGDISTLQVIHEDKPISSNAEILGALWTPKFPWLLALDDKDAYLITPDMSAKTSYIAAPIPARVAAAKASASPAAAPPPSPSASAASSAASPEPSPSASAVSSAAAVPPANEGAPASGLTDPKPFTAACTTPFVLLASPPKPGQAYATTREGLRGHGEFQDLVTFVEIVVAGKTYFGVQTRTETDANQFISLVEQSIKGMKPALRCLDVLSLVPDRYAPPEGIRIVGINLTTGELVAFD